MNGPRRIGVFHLIHHLRLGGAEMFLAELVSRLDPAEFRVMVGCVSDRGDLFERLTGQGISTVFLNKRRGLEAVMLWNLRRLLRAEDARIMHTHDFPSNVWGRVAALAAGTPVVVDTVHVVPGWQARLKQELTHPLLEPVTDRFVAVSGCVRTALVEQKRIRPEKIEVIPNGVRADRFYRSLDPAADRRALGLPEDRPLIAMVARCSREKGGPHFIEAMARVKAPTSSPLAVLIGDGPRRAEWEAAARALGVGDRVRFVGAQPDVPRWLAVMDLVVCPSVEESFGLSALEAQAAGLPVVATRVGGFLEVLEDEVDALLAPPGDGRALAAAIERLLHDPALGRRLGEAGRDKVRRRYSLDQTVRRYEALYRTLADAPRARRVRVPSSGRPGGDPRGGEARMETAGGME